MILAALVVAAGLAAAPPDGTYSFGLEQSGASIGTATVTLKHADAGVLVHETQDIKLGGSSLNYLVDETLDPGSLAPRSYVATYTKDGTPAVAELPVAHGTYLPGIAPLGQIALPVAQ